MKPESRDQLLLCFMYYVCTGNDASYLADCESAGGEATQLEKALSILRSLEPLCTDDITQLASTVASMIRRQVLYGSISFMHALY